MPAYGGTCSQLRPGHSKGGRERGKRAEREGETMNEQAKRQSEVFVIEAYEMQLIYACFAQSNNRETKATTTRQARRRRRTTINTAKTTTKARKAGKRRAKIEATMQIAKHSQSGNRKKQAIEGAAGIGYGKGAAEDGRY